MHPNLIVLCMLYCKFQKCVSHVYPYFQTCVSHLYPLVPNIPPNFKVAMCQNVRTRHGLQGGVSASPMQCGCATDEMRCQLTLCSL